MASLPDPPVPVRRQSTNTMNDDSDLTQSLRQLSLTTSSMPASPLLAKPHSPLPQASRGSSPSPHRRALSRSSSNGRTSRDVSPSLARKASANSVRSAHGALPAQSSPRRTSSAQNISPKLKPVQTSIAPETQEKTALTPEMIARTHFEAELASHHGQSPLRPTDTVVILNDAVYGHRFSRPRTSRSALSTIVERPERIKAAVLGISAAYVRLGERHCEGAFPLHPSVDATALPSIPFHIHKTTRMVPLLSQAVSNVHGTKWMEELKIMCDSAEAKLAMGGKELQRPDMNRGPDHPRPEKLHEGDLYLCSESRNAMEGALGAVCEAVDLVFQTDTRRAFVGVRPPGHHCSASHPSGFCWVNNVHVGIMHAALEHGLTHAAIIDFDLHHGDGSQDITWQHNARAINATKNAAAWKKTSIGYFSIHDINSYPCEMGDEEKVKNASLCIENAHGQTVWNVHLQSWNNEAEFWQLYESRYAVLLEKTRGYLRAQSQRLRAANQKPKAAIFISAGFDASEWEGAGMQRHQVNVPTEFYARLTQDIIKLAAEEGLGTDGRVISVLEGGYSDRALFSGILSHLSGLVSNQKPDQHPGDLQSHDNPLVHKYNPSWWSSAELAKLEIAPIRPPSPPKKPKLVTIGSYSSPTQASVARAVDPEKARRSFSNASSNSPQPVIPRAPTPPPPEVAWNIAAHQLAILLIPSTRQTDSCKAEDLNAEATRARRERQSLLAGVPVAVPEPVPERPSSKMALRERRTKPVPKFEERSTDQAARNRRKTVGMTSPPSDNTVVRSGVQDTSSKMPERRTSRRLSGSAALLGQPLDQPSGHAQSGQPLSEETASQTAGPSTKAAGNKLTVKKSRAPTVARRDTAPKLPRVGQKITTPPSEKQAADLEPPLTAPPATSRTDVDDLDQITRGMKKIRINLITQSKKEAREKARLDAEKSLSSPAFEQLLLNSPLSPSTGDETLVSPLSGLPTPLPVDTPKSEAFPVLAAAGESVGMSPATTDVRNVSTPIQDDYSSDIMSPDLPQRGHPDVSSVPVLAVQPSSDPADVFIPYQPDGPAPVAVAQTEALKWLPPNASMSTNTTPAATPSPVKRQDKLFHYTTGIPFAPRAQTMSPTNSPAKTSFVPSENAKVDEEGRLEQDGSGWDIPASPHKGPGATE